MGMKIINWVNTNRTHFIAWSLLFIFEAVTIGLTFGVFGHPLTYLVHNFLIISLFYAHGHLLLPWALKDFKNSLWKFPLILIVELGVYISCSFFADTILIKYGAMNHPGMFTISIPYVSKAVYRALYFLGFATGYYYLLNYLNEKRKTIELEKQHWINTMKRQKAEDEMTKAQNAFLMAQINPHFFFNTLDFLYHNVLESSPLAAEAITSLASMMRFSIDADRIGKEILIDEELEQVENLIYLNKMRKPLYLKFEVEQAARQLYLIPLVVLTLVENVFKHGNLSMRNHEALIKLSINQRFLVVQTRNLSGLHLPSNRRSTGLVNIAKRLDLAYGTCYKFEYIKDSAGYFIVSLMVPLAALRKNAVVPALSKEIDIV